MKERGPVNKVFPGPYAPVARWKISPTAPPPERAGATEPGLGASGPARRGWLPSHPGWQPRTHGVGTTGDGAIRWRITVSSPDMHTDWVV